MTRILALALLSCAALPPMPDAVPLSVRGTGVCLGARITPTLLVTAKHCTTKGWPLRVDDTLAETVGQEAHDLAYMRVPEGPFVPKAAYSGEGSLTVSTWVGLKAVSVTYVGNTWIELDLECLPGWSGSPVYSSRGQVAVVSRGAQGRKTCYAELIP